MGKFDLDDVINDQPAGRPAKGGAGAQAKPAEPHRAAAGTKARKGDPGKGDHSLTPLYSPDASSGDGQTDDLGKLLLARSAVNEEQLATAERVLKQTPGKRLAAVLIEMGVDEIAVQEAVAEISRLHFERIDPKATDAYDLKALHKLGSEYCKTNLVMPLRREGSRMVVGTTSPDDVFVLDDVKRRLGVPSVKHVLVAAMDIRAAIENQTESEAEEYNVDEILSNVDEDDVEVTKDASKDDDVEDADSSPVVKYVNHIIQTAVKEGASDIHVEPDEKTLKVRFRIDGVLFEMMNPPRKMHAALTSRIKIMSNLDIAERRLPQDGRIRATVLGRKLDLRVSTVPTPKGEKVVMRILDNRSISVTLDDLGFAEDTLMEWKNQIAQPHGIILVTGPTGSGKTTTLYASIQQMDLRKLNISTVEDPVEYNLANITQIQTHEKIGMTFSAALRSLMRQDPDVIMVGEIRDMETATIAIQAAMTGHLVLSTLHTNDAPASITRLINIGIEPFLVGAAVHSVLAQRLIRRVCKHCGADITNAEVMKILKDAGLKDAKLRQGKGCEKCRKTGYSGRCGLYELLVLNDELCDAIARNPNVTEFRRQCITKGMLTLRQDGLRKVAGGVTTLEEVLSVTEDQRG
ncbi:MAG: Flp pilus assembly complex ATPase component TadA, partial [Phycisphaerales bacterium]|nr:Flp pilus assembly complex ATPase component TadA [Phycisphaerales bacterium]